VRQLGLQQLLEREGSDPQAPQEITYAPAMSELAGHVRKAWETNKMGKEKIGLRLLDCLRARRGIYSAAEIARFQEQNAGGGNMVWAPLTEVKCRAASAWIREIVLPAGEQPWGISPTPLADLPMPLKQAVVQKALVQAQQVMAQTAQAGGGVMAPDEFRSLARELGEKLKDDAEKEYVRIAEKRAKRMEKQIADRLAEGGYAQAMDAFVEDFSTYPAAILKGPIYKRHRTLSWGPGFKPEVSDKPAQTYERVSPFDAFPSLGSEDCQTGDFIERVRFRRPDLFDLKGMPGYRDEEIDKALTDYTEGHLEGWLWTESERQRLEQETRYLWLSPPGVIDALNYWGSVPGWKLLSWGVKGKIGEPLEPTRDYECNVLLCGTYVLFASLNPHPLNRRPYHKACYDSIPGAFWGRDIPDLASMPQKMCNAVACATADNLSIASGPQVWVHTDRLADGEQSLEVFPWRVWQLKSDPTQGTNPGIGFQQPDDRSTPLMALYEKWEIRADDSTGIPRYTYGNERAGGSADTATGLSMLMNNAAKGLRRGISNIDMGVISQTIYDTFVNEMIYNPDESIKGDCIVVPRGAAAILIKESAQQRRMQFLGMTANPMDFQIIGARGRASLLRETAAAMELSVDDVVPSDEEIDKQMQQQAQAQQQQMQAEQDGEMKMKQLELAVQGQREAAVNQREAANGERDAQAKQQETQMKLIGDIVKAAVTAALAPKKEPAKAGA
jgi:hypothetical protein